VFPFLFLLPFVVIFHLSVLESVHVEEDGSREKIRGAKVV
jgi:hypothetical protein